VQHDIPKALFRKLDCGRSGKDVVLPILHIPEDKKRQVNDKKWLAVALEQVIDFTRLGAVFFFQPTGWSTATRLSGALPVKQDIHLAT
jgi:hypothetical protein